MHQGCSQPSSWVRRIQSYIVFTQSILQLHLKGCLIGSVSLKRTSSDSEYARPGLLTAKYLWSYHKVKRKSYGSSTQSEAQVSRKITREP